MNMLCLRARAVIAVCQLSMPCRRSNSESVMPCPNSTGTSSLRPWATCHDGPFFLKNFTRFSVPGMLPSGQLPVATPSTSAL